MTYIRSFSLFSLFFAFSANAAELSYSLSQLSISFIIGISLPVLFFAVYRSLSQPTVFVFPSLLFISLLFLIGCISQNAHGQGWSENHLWLCSAANVYVGLLLLMPNRADWLAELKLDKIKYLTVTLLLLFALFELSLFFIPALDHKLTWLAWSVSYTHLTLPTSR